MRIVCAKSVQITALNPPERKNLFCGPSFFKIEITKNLLTEKKMQNVTIFQSNILLEYKKKLF